MAGARNEPSTKNKLDHLPGARVKRPGFDAVFSESRKDDVMPKKINPELKGSGRADGSRASAGLSVGDRGVEDVLLSAEQAW
jgi:hypothetical protein